MSATNNGNQRITFHYRHPVTAEELNNLLRGIIEQGIYSGGKFSNTGNNLSIDPYILFMNSGLDKVLKIQSSAPAVLDTTGWGDDLNPKILYLQFTWMNSITPVYIDFLYAPIGTIFSDFQMPIGVLNFTALGNLDPTTPFTYEYRKFGFNKDTDFMRLQGRSPDYVSSVVIGTGSATNPQYFLFTNQLDSQLLQRVELVWGIGVTLNMILEYRFQISYDAGVTWQKVITKVNLHDGGGNFQSYSWS